MFDDYINWQMSRVNGLEKYVGFDFFKGKTLHEIGCGYAFFGNFLSDYCLSVSVSDARSEHINYVKKKFPKLNSSIIDVDGRFETEDCDILINFGVLYHIKNIEQHMGSLKKFKYVFLETEVCDMSEVGQLLVDENMNDYDQAYNGVGIKPSQKLVESLLKKNGFNFKCITDSVLNADGHFYDWELKNTQKWSSGYRRFWICWNEKLNSPLK